ncbi:MAG: hypothetical protein Q4E22_00905 [Coriobacteriia bacterium]|nr:hypothetical protein [Coriobacteriia bacterium]
MLKQDYLLRMIEQFNLAIETSIEKEKLQKFEYAQDTLEDTLAHALDMSSQTLLALSPESFLTIVKLSQINEEVAIYISFILFRLSNILQAQDPKLAQLREAQGRAVAKEYGFEFGLSPQIES